MLHTTQVVTVVTHTDHTAEWLAFWGKAIGAAAWPVALVVLALLFHKPVFALLEKLSDFEGWGFKASFKREVGQLVEETARAGLTLPSDADIVEASPPVAVEPAPPADNTTPPPTIAVTPTRQSHPGLWNSTAGPDDLVIRAWAEIEHALLRAGAANGIGSNRDVQVMLMLMDAGKLRAETVALIENARHIRSKLAHGGRVPGYGDAVLYLTSAQSIAQAILREAGITE